ncbi:MAG: hypothetical protein WC708_00155 [Lentisphaeria bacterium]
MDIGIKTRWQAKNGTEYVVTHKLESDQIERWELDPTKVWYSIESDLQRSRNEIQLVPEEFFSELTQMVAVKISAISEEQEGVKAIQFLQKMVGITETDEDAIKGWRGMAEWEKASTMAAYGQLKHLSVAK